MKINIYYGGRGLIGDPTLYVINVMQSVLEELNVQVTRYNLHELKSEITTLPNTLKSADGVIFATTVEWYGIGGCMQSFLDACWLYADKEYLKGVYMCPVVMSTTYGERDGKKDLATSWEILGGKPCSGICGYIKDTAELEKNSDYKNIIEKKAENMYRTIQQKLASFPASYQEISRVVGVYKNMDLTPQETEQLSKYAANENYVQKQKADIEELSSRFKEMLDINVNEERQEYISELNKCFRGGVEMKATYRLTFEGRKKSIIIKVNNNKMECYFGDVGYSDVDIHMKQEVMSEITEGRMTFQRAFMAGSVKFKGEFKTMRMLDQIFNFGD